MPPQVDPITSYLEPKPLGGVRRMALLSERDSIPWEGIADRIDEGIRERLNPGVLVHGSLTGANLVRSLRRARAAAGKLARRSNAVIVTDITAFYPSVTPTVAFSAIGGIGADAETARQAAGMLEGWGSEGYPGLPIGPPGSAILANAILSEVDAELAGIPFLRWMDDYAVGLPGENAAGEALERVDGALARVGLRRSTSKTRFLEGGRSFPWLGTYGRSNTSE